MSKLQHAPLFGYLSKSTFSPKSKPHAQEPVVPPKVTDRTRAFAELERYRPEQRFAVKRCRKLVKQELLHWNPFCSHCGMEVQPIAGAENSAHLVRGRLSCPDCVKTVRTVGRAEKEARRQNLADGESR